ncbi:TPA: hypothetical protein NIH83_005103 [Pseudomonas aeruginosa]|nr:hypothetical protein [Pseudomonas aeruginosa]HCF6191623.1 hypothetical protein [Pseudomonas aeruginosa]
MIKNNSKAPSCTCPSGDGSLRHPCPAHPAAERPELWAVHAQGPDELYAAFTREDADKHAADLNALPMPEGITVGAVVVSSPWPAAEHWQYLAEQERDHKNEIAVRLRQFERICEGLPQDAIDGGWTVQGIRGYAKRLEDQLKVAQAEVEALRAELQSQRERNTELIFKLGSATNGWGRCEKERDTALARCAELEAELDMANDAVAKGDATRHQCAGMEMEIKELRGAADHWEAESRALQKLRDAALARVKALEALVAARIKDVPVDASVIALVGDFNEEQVHECKRFHDTIRAQCNPEAIVVFLSSTNDIQAVDEAAMCSAGWARTDAPVTQTQSGDHSELRRIAVALKNPLLSGDEASDLMVRYEALTMPDHIIALIDSQAQHSVPLNAAALVAAEGRKYSLNAAGMFDSGAPEHAQTFAIVQLLSEFDDEEAESHWEAIMAYSDLRTSDALWRAAELLTASPGNEVPKAWLVGQTERRMFKGAK